MATTMTNGKAKKARKADPTPAEIATEKAAIRLEKGEAPAAGGGEVPATAAPANDVKLVDTSEVERLDQKIDDGLAYLKKINGTVRAKLAKLTAERVKVYHSLGVCFLRKKEVEGDHGTWLPFLTKRGLKERTVQRWMKLAKCDVTSDLVKEWRDINGNERKEDEERKKAEKAANKSVVPTVPLTFADQAAVDAFQSRVRLIQDIHTQEKLPAFDLTAFVREKLEEYWVKLEESDMPPLSAPAPTATEVARG